MFPKIDLRLGYHQLKIKAEDIPRTAVQTRYGYYEFFVLYFGLDNALTSCMSLMNRVFKSFLDSFIIVFIDDTPIYYKNKKEHETYLYIVIEFIGG